MCVLMLSASRQYYFSGLLGIKILTFLPGYLDLGPGQGPRLCVQQMPSDSYLMFERCIHLALLTQKLILGKTGVAFIPTWPNTLHPCFGESKLKGNVLPDAECQ